MNLLQDIITYVRRIIKTPSGGTITDALIIDYINRFWIMDVDARMQLFDLKTKYQFQTQPGVDKYNMPLYSIQQETTPSDPNYQVSYYPVYQGFLSPAFVNGIQIPFYTVKNSFYNIWPNYVQNNPAVIQGDGGQVYNIQIPLISSSQGVNQIPPGLLRGHVDITGVIASASSTNVLQDPIFGSTISTVIPQSSIYPFVYFTSTDINGNNVVVQDSGQFLQIGAANMPNYGLLMSPGSSPYGYAPLPGGYVANYSITGATNANPAVLTVTSPVIAGQFVTIEGVLGMTQLNGNTYEVLANSGTTLTINVNSTAFTAYSSGGTASTFQNYINYQTGFASVTFPVPIPAGQNINVQTYFYEPGLPRAALFDNNCITLRNPPDTQYLVEIDAYLSPAAFFSQSQSIQFAYMCEYLARGAARKILSDTGDIEQFAFYEPLFKEQELLVWKRSQRQITANRSETIYSNTGFGNGFATNGLYGSGAT